MGRGKPRPIFVTGFNSQPIEQAMTAAPFPAARVLVVEDDDSIATALEFLLTREGLILDRARDGLQALDRAPRFKPDLVVLDIVLPGISGYEVCTRLRANPDMGQLKILMMTARGSATERKHALAHGADGFIPKPFETAALRAEVARLIGRQA